VISYRKVADLRQIHLNNRVISIIYACIDLPVERIAIYDKHFNHGINKCTQHIVNFVPIINYSRRIHLENTKVKSFMSINSVQVNPVEVLKLKPNRRKVKIVFLEKFANFLTMSKLFKVDRHNYFKTYSFPHNVRFAIYKSLLLDSEGISLIVDSRDAFFQKCPGCLVEYLEPGKCLVVAEGNINGVTQKSHSLSLNKSNKRWLIDLVGTKTYRKLDWSDSKVICSGFLMGENQVLAKVVSDILEVMKQSKKFISSILDQAALNYVYYNDKNKFKVLENGFPVFHMATSPESHKNLNYPSNPKLREFSISSGSLFLQAKMPIVVHQFDRFFKIDDFFI